MITVGEVRKSLGENYSTYPADDVIQSFIEQREAELEAVIGIGLSDAPHQALLKKWLLNKVCADVLQYDLIGKESQESASYAIAELKEDRSKNIELKQEWIQILNEAAEKALNTWFLKTKGYKAVSP